MINNNNINENPITGLSPRPRKPMFKSQVHYLLAI